LTSTLPNGFHSPQKFNGKGTRFQSDPKFPRIVEVKIFLKAAENGEIQARALLCEKCQEEEIISITCRLSSKGSYHSFTCRLWIASETDLIELHEHLCSQEQVLYIL